MAKKKQTKKEIEQDLKEYSEDAMILLKDLEIQLKKALSKKKKKKD